MATATATTTARLTPTGLRLRRSTSSPASTFGLRLVSNSITAGMDKQSSPPSLRRRNSSLSDYSQEARDLLNPSPPNMAASEAQQRPPVSSWDSLPLAFAILPAIGGLFVPGGGAFVTDLMLLALGAVFLHWSVTQPWAWYYSAQQVRKDQQVSMECAVDSDVDSVQEDDVLPGPTSLQDVPEEDEDGPDAQDAQDSSPTSTDGPAPHTPSTPTDQTGQRIRQQTLQRRLRPKDLRQDQDAALRELYRHEVYALLSCFIAPVCGAALLHVLRDQLSRPSEGLVSGYNLTVFLLGAELRPLRHLLRLVQARTLHLQRLVHANPYCKDEVCYCERRAEEEQSQNAALAALEQRLAALENDSRSKGKAAAPPPVDFSSQISTQVQPQLDMLARALRRTHKQQSILKYHVIEEMHAVQQRLDDAVAACDQQKKLQQQLQLQQQTVTGLVGLLWAGLAGLLYTPLRVVSLLRTLVLAPFATRSDSSTNTSSSGTSANHRVTRKRSVPSLTLSVPPVRHNGRWSSSPSTSGAASLAPLDANWTTIPGPSGSVSPLIAAPSTAIGGHLHRSPMRR